VKVLVGITSYGTAKSYMDAALYRNMLECVSPLDVDVVVYGDRRVPGLPYAPLDFVPTTWSDDMTYVGRDHIRFVAQRYGYDAFIWQGIDCLYDSAEDFQSFLARADASEYDAIGALTAARNRPDYPVARRFVENTSSQVETSTVELMSGDIIPAGFPGADALLVKSNLFHLSWRDWDYTPWYNYAGKDPICVEEFWCMKVLNLGYSIGLDTSIRTWHVHETGLAARWPNETKNLSEFS